MNSTVNRWLALVASGVLIGLASVPASAEDPAGAGLYSQTSSLFCLTADRSTEASVTVVILCAGKNIDDDVQSPALQAPSNAQYNLVIGTIDTCATNSAGAYECGRREVYGHVSDSEFNVAAFLGKGSLHATVGDCRIDVDVVSTSLYQEGGGSPEFWHGASEGGAGFWLTAEEEVARQAAGSGSMCGESMYGTTGVIGHYLRPTIRGWAQPPAA